MKKKPILKPRIYPILTEAVESGVMWGIKRAFKYTEKPTQDALIDYVTQEVLNALLEDEP